MRVEVDQSGHDEPAARIDDPFDIVDRQPRFERRYPTVAEAHVELPVDTGSRIDDTALADDEIEQTTASEGGVRGAGHPILGFS